MRRILLTALLASGLAACGNPAEEADDPEPTATETMMPVEPDDGIGDGGTPTAKDSAEPKFVATMPVKLRGNWHKDDLDRAPTVEDCNPRLRGTIDWDRLITIDENGYTYFETGGRIIEVHNRTDTMIDATFDTTYADTPTTARRDFALQANGTLAVNDDDGDGVISVTQYRLCSE